jgi:hypothetical protein
MKSVRTLTLGLLLVGATLCLTAAAQSPAPEKRPAPASGLPEVVIPVQNPYGGTSYVIQRGPAAGQASQLAREYVKAEKEGQKKVIRRKLNDVLGQQFDQQMQQQQKELEALEKQLDSLRTTLKNRREARDTIIERRADQLIHEAEGLGWNAPGPPRPYYGPAGAGAPLFRPANVPPLSAIPVAPRPVTAAQPK